ncbi:hypothetical protein BDP27DRAFT_1323424 [Rhodocollybia butyracea]|uniref:Uncharacterized protein n=1 Tax=Rhodocollybia butyracea TaxID=206335 RepID=A0A9P5U830_9AGAR|nr:hypothetical protein BDP27DRAFT_1323424 [Rhodocollybia butyracea]
MNTTEIITFPELPTELIREIIEFAACSCTKTRLTFISVSSAIRFWTLPILYNTVVLRTASDVKSFWHTISSSPTSNPQLVPHIPLSMRVQHLAIFALGPLQSIEDIITRCENVQSLACGFSLSSYAASNLKLPTAATIHEFPAQSQNPRTTPPRVICPRRYSVSSAQPGHNPSPRPDILAAGPPLLAANPRAATRPDAPRAQDPVKTAREPLFSCPFFQKFTRIQREPAYDPRSYH